MTRFTSFEHARRVARCRRSFPSRFGGALFVWGAALGCNASGEVLSLSPVPTVSITPTVPPVLVSPDAGPVVPNAAADVFVSAGWAHSCALIGSNVYCWGANANGQLGSGDMANRREPAIVSGEQTWILLAAGGEHSCGVDDLGRVYCWGGNSRGQLGVGDRQARTRPIQVVLPGRALTLAARFNHTCVLLVDASAYCWGQNGEGELGQADAFPGNQSESADMLLPVRVGQQGFRAIDTGQGHTCGIRLDGSLWCWGRNSENELGVEGEIQIREPVQVGSLTDWLRVAMGQSHSCALKEDLSLHCWGENVGASDGEGSPLGLPSSEVITTPTQVGSSSDWTALSTNTFHTCAINRGNQLFCWGRNTEGQLGLGDNELRREPTLVSEEVARVSAGRFHTCAVAMSGVVRCAGANEAGQLGLGDLERRNVFAFAE